jgi:molybdopterin-guanine dinucleotide biosynthesis protein A
VLSPGWRNSGASALRASAGNTHGVSEPASYAVVVVAGGSSSRLGGGDKTALDLGTGQSVLGHLVSSLDTSVPVVVVGPRRPLERSVRWAREIPEGGGPLAGVAAGVAALDLSTAQAPWVVVLAGDQPFAAAGIGAVLDARTPDVDAVVGVDGSGRDQPLLAVYRRSVLVRELGSDPAGRSMRSLLDRLTLSRVPLPELAALDIDDPESLSAARAAALSSGPGSVSGSERPAGPPTGH